MDIGSAQAPEIIAGTLLTLRAESRLRPIRQPLRCIHVFGDRAWSIRGVFPRELRDVLRGALKQPHPQAAYFLVDADFRGPRRPRIIYPQKGRYMIGRPGRSVCCVRCPLFRVMSPVPLPPASLYSFYLFLFHYSFRPLCALLAARVCAFLSGIASPFPGEAEKLSRFCAFRGCMARRAELASLCPRKSGEFRKSECVSRPAYAMIRRDSARQKWGGKCHDRIPVER